MPVVLVHAYVESWRYFTRLIDSLGGSLHCLAPTQRGHGSVVGDPAGFALEDFAVDLVAFLEVTDTGPAVIVGASSGGLVAQRVAATRPDLVAGLVLVGSPAELSDKPEVARMGAEIMALEDPVDPGFVEEFVRGTTQGSLPDDVVAGLVAETLLTPAVVWREWFTGLLEAERQALSDISAPTLLISGADDPFVRADQEVLASSIADVRSVVHDGAGHGPHLVQPDRVAADLVAFVRGRAVAPRRAGSDP